MRDLWGWDGRRRRRSSRSENNKGGWVAFGGEAKREGFGVLV